MHASFGQATKAYQARARAAIIRRLISVDSVARSTPALIASETAFSITIRVFNAFSRRLGSLLPLGQPTAIPTA